MTKLYYSGKEERLWPITGVKTNNQSIINQTAECSHVKNHLGIKICESNFGEFMVIRQSFSPPMLPSIQYILNRSMC